MGEPVRRAPRSVGHKNPELLPLIRSSYGLAGIVYEVTFRIKPLEILRLDYDVRPVKELTQAHIASVIASNQSMVCWTIDDTVVIQTRNQATELHHEWLAGSRRFAWNFLGAFSSRVVSHLTSGAAHGEALEDVGFDIELVFYRLASRLGGFTLYAPDKMIDYSKTARIARYAFTFWAFPKEAWVENIKAYVEFRDAHFHQLAAVVHPCRRCDLDRSDPRAGGAQHRQVGPVPRGVQ
ncbi:MAG: hypothetical protein ABIS06_02640 [Vicinamibacterales bacterium]